MTDYFLTPDSMSVVIKWRLQFPYLVQRKKANSKVYVCLCVRARARVRVAGAGG